MVGKSELIWVWTRKPGENIGECQEGGWGHALVKSFSEKEDKLPLWAPKNEPKLSRQTHWGQVSCDDQKSLNFASGAGMWCVENIQTVAVEVTCNSAVCVGFSYGKAPQPR